MTRRRSVATATAIAVALAGWLAHAGPASAGAPAFADGFGGLHADAPWAEGSVHGSWTDQFNGMGTSQIVADDIAVLDETPRAAVAAAETHAALVTSPAAFGDLDLHVAVRTVRQLRPDPNPWEVGWVLWHESDPQRFYDVVLKPTGWELDKEDPAYPGGQRFLDSGPLPFAIGMWHTVDVVQRGDAITVSADGTLLTRFVDTERPYLAGHLGLYTEDAEAHFGAVSVGP